METVKAIKYRRSIRRYTSRLSEESLQAVLMTGKAAPIGMARYREMHMTVIRDKATLDEFNRNAAEYC
ncbi:MAG: hypothetical protein LUF25_06855 [Phascolarctobacterium sp.]|nr:hypothetical protein [Phascolarctobacterium sp.]